MIVGVIIVMMPLVWSVIRPILSSVFVMSIFVIDSSQGSVLVTMSRFLGLGVVVRLLAFHELGVDAGSHISIMTALKKFLELEHVGLDNSMLLLIFNAAGLWLSEEHLFAQLSVVG